MARSAPDAGAVDPDTLIDLVHLAERVKRGDGRPSADDAVVMARQLMGCYRARDFVDVRIFSASLSAVLGRRDAAVVRLVVDPVEGLPARSPFPPSLAEVNEALDAAEARILAVGRAAARVLGHSHPSSR